ncbi:MAG TPA: hypothetical protein VK638_51355 [Edaphobacter sp.]|nr:hypothetical protein [Edaphobacter sp.]
MVTLALGIAVNATMFSLVSAFLMPHLPGRDPQRLVVVSSVNPDASFQADINPVSPHNYLEWRKNTRIPLPKLFNSIFNGLLFGAPVVLSHCPGGYVDRSPGRDFRPRAARRPR